MTDAVLTDPDDTTLNATAACPACPHLAAGHDATGRRWCAATAEGRAVRGCICPPSAVLTPVADAEAAAPDEAAPAVKKARAKAATPPADRMRGSYADRMRGFSGDFDVVPGLGGQLVMTAIALDTLAEGLRAAAEVPELTATQRHHLGALLDQLR